jgi:deoxyribonuclease V
MADNGRAAGIAFRSLATAPFTFTLGSALAIAFLDVHYKAMGARAACVVADSWQAESPASTYVQEIEAVEPYEPGKFYLRELPCLVSVLRLLPSLPETVVVDGYVWLPSGDRLGLGARLYEALGRGMPVVGIAKTAFAGAESCAEVMRVLRGTSRKPLFVTAVGMEPDVAARCVRSMAGKHRIPGIVKITDRLSRSGASSGRNVA